MRFYVLLMLAVVVPALWGWVVYWLIQRFWPMPESRPALPPPVDPPSSLSDFQI